MAKVVKISLVVPEELYKELKRRAVEERRAVKELIIDAILAYLARGAPGAEDVDVRKLVNLITSPTEGAGPEDLEEYAYSDIGV